MEVTNNDASWPARWSRPLAVLLSAYWLALGVGTHWPGVVQPPGVPHQDKFLHFTAYAGLATLLFAWLSSRGWAVARAQLWTWCGLLAYGALDEITQYPVPGRSSDPWDLVADMAGVSVALVVCRWLAQWALRGGRAQ